MDSNSLLLPPPVALLVPKPEPKVEPYDDLLRPPASTVPPASNRIWSFQNYVQQESDGSGSDPTPDSRAIVPLPNPESQIDADQSPPNERRKPARSSELVRVLDLKPEDHGFYRDRVRKIRKLYDSLRVSGMASKLLRDMGINRDDTVTSSRRSREDLKTGAVMGHNGLWLNRDKRIVGNIPGIAIGDVFFFRAELCVLGLHAPPQAGIDFLPSTQSLNGEPIATSIIVSGGYEDDYDIGEEIIYSGHGGQNSQNRQVADQKLEGGNWALERSMHYCVEVRVIRGLKSNNGGKLYVYDGLYQVTDYWLDIGISGFRVYKFKLSRFPNQLPMGSAIIKFAANLRSCPLNLLPKGYLSLDLSSRREPFPVFLYNDIDQDNDPLFHDYLVSSILPHLCHNKTGYGCNCVRGCTEGCFCAMRNGGTLPYDSTGTLVRGKPLIFECGPYCSCPPGCRNRVSQKGIRTTLEVFRSRETSWGVRALEVIPAGSFICEYAGVVLTREQAQLFTMNGDSLVYPGCFVENWKTWGDLSLVIPGYTPPNYPSIAPLDFALDVSKLRNVACYISHSSRPNVMVQPVLFDHDSVAFPRLMVFALESIPPMREFTLDYGVPDECTTGKLAIGN